MKKTAILIGIFGLGLLWRMFLLDTIPTALHPDELAYSINAQSFLLSGTSLDGQWSPLKFNTLTPMLAEWPTLITSVGYFFSNNPLVATRLPSVLMGSLIPFILAWITWGLFKKRELSWGVLIVSALNPWILQNSRFGFDPFYSVFFYGLAIGCLLNFADWKKYFSLPLFALGFLQYQGYKLLLLPIVAILLLRSWQDQQFSLKKLLTKQNLIVGIFAGLVFFGYLFKLRTEGASSRISDSSLFGESYLGQIATKVNFERRLATQSKLTPYFSNKIFSLGLERLDLIADALSPKHLFLSGDPGNSGFSVWSHGFFYLIDGVLIFAGLYFLLHKKQDWQNGWPLLGFLGIGLLPLLINTTNRWFIFRPSFSYLALMMLAGLGLGWLWQKKNVVIKMALVIALAISLVNFSFHYFVRYPVYSVMGNYFDHRQLSNYLIRASQNKPVVVYSPEAESLFQSYLLYGQQINFSNLVEVQYNYRLKYFSLGNVTFKHECVPADKLSLADQIVVVDPYEEKCRVKPEAEERVEFSPETQHLALASVIDSGETYFIYGDTLCQADQLQTFISAKTLAAMSLDKLTDESFCQNWLTNVEKLKNK